MLDCWSFSCDVYIVRTVNQLKYLIILTFLSVSIQAQDCSIDISGTPVICSPQEVELSINGNVFDAQWFDSTGTKLDTGRILSIMVEQSTTFFAVNRLNLGNELIINGDFEAGNTGFDSDYFESCVNGTMPQGAFCISDNSDYYHAGWSECFDHTSGSGKMFITDAANVPNQKVWCQTVNNVQPNQTYAFSTQVTAVFPTAPPVLQFSINGDLLGEPFAAPSDVCAWNEFFQTWESGPNTSAEICIVNQNTIGQGNDFALDDLSFRTVCVDSAEYRVELEDEISVDLGEDRVVCDGDDVVIGDNRFKDNPDYSSVWEDGVVGSVKTVNSIGSYSLTVEDVNGCKGSDTINLTDIGMPESLLNQDTVVCFGVHDSVELYAGSALNVVWYDEERNPFSGERYKITKPGTYTVELVNGDNCITTDQISVDTLCSRDIFFPNAFTPNGDGLNDTFEAYAVDAYGFEIVIFNNWGEIVYESNDLFNGWDGTINGKNAVQGVYVYKCTYTLLNRESGGLKEETSVGHLTLIR